MRKSLFERVKKSILFVLVLLMVAGCLPAAPHDVHASTLISKVSVTLERINSYKKNDLLYSQYRLKVTNKGKKAVTTWKIQLNMNQSLKVTEKWDCQTSVSGKKLQVSPVSYNKTIAAGKSEEASFVLYSKSTPKCTSAKITATINKKSRQRTQKTVSINTGKVNLGKTPAQVTKKSKTPVQQYGRLKVSGRYLVSESGKRVALKGISTHGLSWYPQFVSKASFKTMRDEWGVECVRLAMYTASNGGYCTNGDQEALKALIDKGVEAATSLGLYVIIDWHVLHDLNPKKYQKEAEAFFTEMSSRYKNNKNVLYEICNEPNGTTTWKDVKSYAQSILKVIRKNDSKGIVLIGTPHWDQRPDEVLKDPIKGYTNIMYTFHFYSAEHKSVMRARLESALRRGLPIFVSECGPAKPGARYPIDFDAFGQWLKLMKSYSVSYVVWGLSNKNESHSLVEPGCTKTSDYTDDDLTSVGLWFKDL